MKRTPLLGGAFALVVALGLAGCGNSTEMTDDELDRLENLPAPTQEELAQAAEGMAEGAEARRDQQQSWAEQNPEEAARINAERAAAGRPPLGG